MKKVIIILISILQTIILIGCSGGSELRLKYDNNISVTSTNNKTYLQADVESLQNDLGKRTITYKELESKFLIQCLRKTFQGYYIILDLENSIRAFLFLNSNLELKNIQCVDHFNNKSDFNFVEIAKTSLKKVEDFDKNTIYYPISSIDVTGHIVSEGLLLIFYERINDGVLLDDPIVKSIKFISNKEIENMNDDFWVMSTPFILEIDKTF